MGTLRAGLQCRALGADLLHHGHRGRNVTAARARKNSLALPLLAGLCALGGCGFFSSPSDRAAQAEKLLAEGRYREAAIELRTGLDEAPKDAGLHVLLARTALALGVLDA